MNYKTRLTAWVQSCHSLRLGVHFGLWSGISDSNRKLTMEFHSVRVTEDHKLPASLTSSVLWMKKRKKNGFPVCCFVKEEKLSIEESSDPSLNERTWLVLTILVLHRFLMISFLHPQAFTRLEIFRGNKKWQ